MEIASKKLWQMTPRITPDVEGQLKEYPAYLRQMLYTRGCKNATQAEYFISNISQSTTDPFTLKDMELAIDRLFKAIKDGEKIAVYGDYDVDGVSATVLMVEVLRIFDAQVESYIPNRYEEGYGLNNEAIASLYDREVRLIITVDCGVRSVNEVEYARSIGIDMIISDHHQPGNELPPAFAIINPRQPGDVYPDKNLTGVGLAYKIAQALFARSPMEGVMPEDWLDLVALGTIADLAPLTGENRMLVAAGIQRIRTQKRQGLFSLSQVAGLDDRMVRAADIGYILGPRLNAAGRMDSAMAAYELLETKSARRAGELAQLLEKSNFERQVTTREIQSIAAEKAMAASPDGYLIFASDPNFKEGIVGLAASRLVETYYRPAIVAHEGEEFTRGSCRSIPELDITAALDQCADLLVRYGGHKAAAGFTVENRKLPALINKLQKIASDLLCHLDLQPILKIEFELQLDQFGAEEIYQLLKDIDRLQPTGVSNPEPLFCSRNLAVKRWQAVGREKNHLRLAFVDGKGVFHSGIAFKQGYWAEKQPDRVDLVYSLEINEYMGEKRIQFNVKDIRQVAE